MAVYKPPNVNWPNPPLSTLGHRAIYIGDLNCHHTNWGYAANNQNGETLMDWIDENDLYIACGAKDLKTFRSARWQSETNPDLCLVITDIHNIPMLHTRKVLSGFPHSQHRPVLLNIGIQLPLLTTTQKPRWNF